MAPKPFLLGTHRHPSTFTPAVTRAAAINEGNESVTSGGKSFALPQFENTTSNYSTPRAIDPSMTPTAAQGAVPGATRATGSHVKVAAANGAASSKNSRRVSFEEIPDDERLDSRPYEQRTPLQPLLRHVDGLDGPLPVLSPSRYPSISTAPRNSHALLFVNPAPPDKEKGKEVEMRTEGPDILGDLCLPEGMNIPDEPLSASVARYHAPFDPLVDYDPLLAYGAIDGVLPGKTGEESIELRDAIIRWTHPHLGLVWASLPEAIEDMQKHPPLESQLQTHYYNAGANDEEATLFYTASPQVLHEIGQILLPVTQILETMNRFAKGKKTHAYRLDPGYRNLRLMGKSEVAGEVIITYLFLGKRLSLASNHIKTYFNAIRRTYSNTLDLESARDPRTGNALYDLPLRWFQGGCQPSITRAHPISTVPGIGKLPEASALGLHYETPSKTKDTGGPSWTRFSQIVTAPFKTIRNTATSGTADRADPAPAANPKTSAPENPNSLKKDAPPHLRQHREDQGAGGQPPPPAAPPSNHSGGSRAKFGERTILPSTRDIIHEEEYKVEAIMGHKLTGKRQGNQRLCLVRWKGYEPTEDSWVSENALRARKSNANTINCTDFTYNGTRRAHDRFNSA
ncbi:hypothetical protein DXG01_002080 [Tephrocybe rancida]|nr:hypothetical protein DXG01_002080 [Tephrocybe rancida]